MPNHAQLDHHVTERDRGQREPGDCDQVAQVTGSFQDAVREVKAKSDRLISRLSLGLFFSFFSFSFLRLFVCFLFAFVCFSFKLFVERNISFGCIT